MAGQAHLESSPPPLLARLRPLSRCSGRRELDTTRKIRQHDGNNLQLTSQPPPRAGPLRAATTVLGEASIVSLARGRPSSTPPEQNLTLQQLPTSRMGRSIGQSTVRPSSRSGPPRGCSSCCSMPLHWQHAPHTFTPYCTKQLRASSRPHPLPPSWQTSWLPQAQQLSLQRFGQNGATVFGSLATSDEY